MAATERADVRMEAGTGGGVMLGVPCHHAVASLVFGLLQSLVGDLHQCGRAAAVQRPCCQAGAEGDAQ